MLSVFDTSIVVYIHSDRSKWIEKYQYSLKQDKYMIDKVLEEAEENNLGKELWVLKNVSQLG